MAGSLQHTCARHGPGILVKGGGVAVADRYIYQVAVEAFFLRAMKDRLDAGARTRLREAGLSLDEPLLSVYPAEMFHRCVSIAAAAAYPSLAAPEALFMVGRDHIDAFVQSYPGKMMAALARQIEPRMILEYTATFIRLGNNFTESRSRVIGPSHSELWLNDVGEVPDWYRGVVQRGLEVANVKGVDVRELPRNQPPAATFDVTWAGR
jgi:uncharacterized protein (TIGR02265 family)